MKHFSKQLSWLLAFVLIFTSIVSTGIPASAIEVPTIIGEDTDEVFVAGTNVAIQDGWNYLIISYYESADSDTVLDKQETDDKLTIGSNAIAVKPYAWHVTFVKKVQDNSGTESPIEYYFKAYPDTSLENIPVSTPEKPTTMTLAEGTTLTTTGSAINVSIYVGDVNLKDYNAPSSFTLPTASSLVSDINVLKLNSALAFAGYKLPDLTELYYTVELTDKSASPYSLKLTLVPTVELTFDENTGTPDLAGIKKYATPNATIDSTKLPTVSKDGVNFYGWKTSDTDYLSSVVSGASELTAMYKEIKPTFKLDLTNKKVTNLLPNRTYAYSKFDWDNMDYTTIVTDANGEFSYEALSDFEKLAELRLNSQNTAVSLVSDFVSLRHNTPNKPVVEFTATTAKVTNSNDFADCKFAIIATSDDSDLSLGTSSTFLGLTPETEYEIFVQHFADENGFESGIAVSVAFTTLAVKVVSNDAPNGVTIEDISVQAHTNSAIEPVLLITDGDKTLVENTDYTVSYTDNITVGTATATVTFINDYIGTLTKNFEIAYFWLVSFDNNGGKGAMSDVSVKNGEQYTLPACTFTAPANKEFKSWNINGTEYAAGANCTITADTTVTAVWKDWEKVKTPAISPNGGTFSGSKTVTITSETADAIIYYTTDGTEPTTASTVYSTPFTISSSVTVKAIAVKGSMFNSDVASASFTKQSSSSGGSSTYTPPTFTVTFNTDGGSTIDSKSIKQDATVGELPEPTKDGFVFDGWYSDKELTKAYDANTKITASTTLYAKWTKVEPKTDDSSKDDDNSKNELVLTIGKTDVKAFGSDKTMDSAPIIKNNRTMLPARFIAESLGAKVTWNGKKREVTIKGKNGKGQDVTILLYIDSDIAYVNGKKVKLDSPAFIENGRTFTPLRFVAEELGANVEWIAEDKKVVITK